MKESHVIPVTKCPHCRKKLDRTFESGGDAKPRPGDVSVCIRCGGLAIFTDDLGQRLPTEAERLEISNKPHVIYAQIVIRGGR